VIENKKQYQLEYQIQEKENVSLESQISVTGTQYIDNIIGSHSQRSTTSCVSSSHKSYTDECLNERLWTEKDNSYIVKEFKHDNRPNSTCKLS
jgi:DNA polymerase IIIc chi subunit